MSFLEVDGRRYVANIVEIPPYMGFTLEELNFGVLPAAFTGGISVFQRYRLS